MNNRTRFIAGLVVISAMLAVAGTVLLALAPASFAQEAAGAFKLEGIAWGAGLFGAAVATGLSSLGAGIAVGKVGAAAIGALAEKPDLFGRLLIFVGLAEGIAIYGLIISILVLNRLV